MLHSMWAGETQPACEASWAGIDARWTGSTPPASADGVDPEGPTPAVSGRTACARSPGCRSRGRGCGRSR
jgi:hypothetical protein